MHGEEVFPQIRRRLEVRQQVCEVVRRVRVGRKPARWRIIPADLFFGFGYGGVVGIVGIVIVVLVAFLIVVEDDNLIYAENSERSCNTSGKEGFLFNGMAIGTSNTKFR